MLDIRLVRENPQLVKQNLSKRQDPKLLSLLDELIQSDLDWRNLRTQTDSLRHERNQISDSINKAKKSGQPVDALLEKAKNLPRQIKENESNIQELENRNRSLLLRIPNLLDDSVPVGKDASENIEIRRKGKTVKPSFELRHHGELAHALNGADFENAVKISGTGFFFLLGDLALLDLALQRLAIDLLIKKGFVLVQPPFLINREAYNAVAPLSDFEDVLYKIENEDLFLIATSEHPLVSRFLNHTFDPKELPLKFAGVSPCFRREIGKHGLDERGFFRVHQFNKIEQVVLCHPSQSKRLFEELAKNAEEFLQLLNIAFRTVNVCTGEIGIIASQKFDIEGWSPREQQFIELMSCSNCTDYQARRLNAKLFENNEKVLVHTLNNTMVATTRFLRIALENWQTKDGTVKIPKPLWKYMNGKKEIGAVPQKPNKSKSKRKTKK